jgi:hypothetical protein
MILPGTGRWQPKADGGGPPHGTFFADSPSTMLRMAPPRAGEDFYREAIRVAKWISTALRTVSAIFFRPSGEPRNVASPSLEI